MPMYEYVCKTCGEEDYFVADMKNRHDTPKCEYCGGKTKLIISACAGVVRFPAAGGQEYISPASGKYISTAKARKEDLKRTQCRPYEGFESETRQAKKDRAVAEAKSDKKLHDDVSRAYHQLSPTKKRHLGG